MNSPVPNSTEHRTNLEHARHSGFQSLDVEHRTNSRRPLDKPPGTTTETAKMEADEGGGKRRLRQSKTKTVSLWGRAYWQLPYSWRHPRVNTELGTFLVRPAYSRAHESCGSLCNPRSSRGTAPVRSFLNLLPGKRRIMKRWQSPQCCASWSDRRLTKKR